jgi:hypothetical protein
MIEAKGLRVDEAAAAWFKSSASGGNSDNCVEVAFLGDAVLVRDSKDADGPVLLYTDGEWEAFVAGVRAGEFNR